MNEARFQDAEVTLRAHLIMSPTALFNWFLSDERSQRKAIARIERLPGHRLRTLARRRLACRLYQGPLVPEPTMSADLDVTLEVFLPPER